MRLELNAEDLRSSLKSLMQIHREGVLVLTEAGLDIKMADPANACVVAFSLPATDWITFELDKPEIKLALAFDLTVMYLAAAKKDDVVTLTLNGNRLQIEYPGVSYKQTLIAEKTMRSIPKIPVLEYDTVIELNKSMLMTNLKACVKVDDLIHVTMIKDILTIAAKTKSTSVNAIPKDIAIIKNNATSVSQYSASYLTDITNGLGNDGLVKISFGTDFPITFESTVGATGTIKYLLAPRIDN